MIQRKALNRSDLIKAYTPLIKDRLLESIHLKENHIPLELKVVSTNTILSFYMVEGGEFRVYIWKGSVVRYQGEISRSEIEDSSGIQRALDRFMAFQNREGLRELSYLLGGVIGCWVWMKRGIVVSAGDCIG